MNLLGIFMVGLVVTAIVGAACGLIVAGILADRHDRQDNYGEELGQ
jgi:hypothetical protein